MVACFITNNQICKIGLQMHLQGEYQPEIFVMLMFTTEIIATIFQSAYVTVSNVFVIAVLYTGYDLFSHKPRM